MENFLIKKEDDSIIYGSIYNLEMSNPNGEESKATHINDLDVKNIMIACHGFGSSRTRYTIKTLAHGLKDVVVISFDWPGHGDSDEKLLIKNCMDNYEQVYNYAIKRFSKAKVFLFGSSFGGYMTLQFLKKHPECCAEKVFFKSPAIKMEKIFEMIANGDPAFSHAASSTSVVSVALNSVGLYSYSFPFFKAESILSCSSCGITGSTVRFAEILSTDSGISPPNFSIALFSTSAPLISLKSSGVPSFAYPLLAPSFVNLKFTLAVYVLLLFRYTYTSPDTKLEIIILIKRKRYIVFLYFFSSSRIISF